MRSYTALISALEYSGKAEMALGLLQRMLAEGVAPNLFTFNACMKACTRLRDLDQALELLAVMETQGVAPCAVTVTHLMGVCAAEGDAKAAIELFAALREKHTLPPDAIVYSALLNACEKGGRWDYGLAVFDEVRQRRWRRRRRRERERSHPFSYSQGWPSAEKQAVALRWE